MYIFEKDKMSLQFHPLVFGVMLVVAAGTLAYSLWNSSRQQENPYGDHGDRSTHNSNYNSNFDDATSSKSSIGDDDERPHKRRRACERCSICLGSLKNQLRELPCKHIFHNNCITKWLYSNNTCPICRKATA